MVDTPETGAQQREKKAPERQSLQTTDRRDSTTLALYHSSADTLPRWHSTPLDRPVTAFFVRTDSLSLWLSSSATGAL